MSFTLAGNDCMPPISGGYLIVYKDCAEITVVSVASPNYTADRYRDSVNENGDTVEDEDGNEFNISVWSSNVGVDWSVEVATNDDSLEEKIKVEYHANEF